MARIKKVELSIPAEIYDEYQDYLIEELSAREFKDRNAGANTFGDNDAIAEALMADCVLQHLAQVLYNHDGPVSPTPEGRLELEQERDESGNFS
jgi:hypothetical protein